jgi:hypothetical protein
MQAHQKLGIGAPLATVGALASILLPTFGLTNLGRPWSFLLGLLVGLITGLGATLVIAGLIERRCQS